MYVPLSVVPPTELVVRVPVVFTIPATLSVIAPAAPVAVRFTAPPPAAAIVPVMLSAPALFTVTLPPPVLLMPVTVSGLAVLVNDTLPLVEFVALNPVTMFALPSVVPVAELVVSVVP